MSVNLSKRKLKRTVLSQNIVNKRCRCGEIGRHEGLKIPFPLRECRFESGHRYHSLIQALSTGEIADALLITKEPEITLVL